MILKKCLVGEETGGVQLLVSRRVQYGRVLGIQPPYTVRANIVREFGVSMLLQKTLDGIPQVIVIANSFADSADGQQSA